MTIKQSTLEQKWYYRVAKVVFVWIPLILAVLALISVVYAGSNITHIAYVVIGLILYFVVLKIIWRGFLYIVFGGLEDDLKKPIVQAVGQPSASAPAASALTATDKNQIVGWILTLIAIGCIYYAYFIYKSPAPIRIDGGGGGKAPVCISTGCGNLWRCTGTYYLSGVQKRVDACYALGSRPKDVYSDWSGQCRQCP